MADRPGRALALCAVALSACGNAETVTPGADARVPADAAIADSRVGDGAIADARLFDAQVHDARVLDAALPDAGTTGPRPTVGAHALGVHRLWANQSPVNTPPVTTEDGSLIVVSVGRGELQAFVAPADNQGNDYELVDGPHAYTNWSSSGTALYAAEDIAGGPGHVVSNATPPDDEITIGFVEVRGATRIQDARWHEILEPNTLTSPGVTTTGPAVLVAFWWGDEGADMDKTAVPGDGFEVVEAILEEGALVQSAVAVREVDAAGTYSVTWTATPPQGAQLYLVAVQ
jgi:hypothetical protein